MAKRKQCLGKPDPNGERRLIAKFWRSLRIDPGWSGTMRGSLCDLRTTALECLSDDPPDLLGARSATAQALYLLQSDVES